MHVQMRRVLMQGPSKGPVELYSNARTCWHIMARGVWHQRRLRGHSATHPTCILVYAWPAHATTQQHCPGDMPGPGARTSPWRDTVAATRGRQQARRPPAPRHVEPGRRARVCTSVVITPQQLEGVQGHVHSCTAASVCAHTRWQRGIGRQHARPQHVRQRTRAPRRVVVEHTALGGGQQHA